MLGTKTEDAVSLSHSTMSTLRYLVTELNKQDVAKQARFSSQKVDAREWSEAAAEYSQRRNKKMHGPLKISMENSVQ